MLRYFVLSLSFSLAAAAGMSAIPAGAADEAPRASASLRPDAALVSGPVSPSVGVRISAATEATRNEQSSNNPGDGFAARVSTMQPGAVSAQVANRAANRTSAASGDHASISAPIGPENQMNRASAPPGSLDVPHLSNTPPKSK